ncbi:MAG TPA: PAS domain S-box protein [Chitinophagaceae bacterium]
MQAIQNALNILTVEDNDADRYLFQEMLKSGPLTIGNLYSTDRVQEAKELLNKHSIDVVLLDLSLPDSFGIDSYFEIKDVVEDRVAVIILTGTDDSNIALEAINKGAQDYLVKRDCNESLLSKTIQYSLERTHNREVLRQSNERYNMVVRATNDAIWDWNLVTGEVFLVGDTFKKIFGYDIVNAVTPRQLWGSALHPSDKGRVIHRLVRFIREGKNHIWEQQYQLRRADGTYAYVHDRGYMMFNAYGKPIRIIGSIQDITHRKKAEQDLLASEEKYRQMFYKNPCPAWIFDAETLLILEVNDAAIQKYGYSRHEFLQLNVTDIRAENMPDFFQEPDHAIALCRNEQRLWRHKKKNGEILLTEITYYPIDYYGRTAIQVLSQDVTEKLRLQDELAQQQKLKQLHITEAVLSAQEKERSIIGAELHDNINQILATVKLYLDVALADPNPRMELLCKSRKNISSAIEEIRKLSKMLIAPSLKELGLKDSIDELIRNILIVKKMKIRFAMNGLDEEILGKEERVAIYRIVQEQLNNILKYADASNVSIQLREKKRQISLLIEDDGRGFDINCRRKGVGITNIISRAELFNGKVEIDSAPGKGCRVKVLLNTREFVPESK